MRTFANRLTGVNRLNYDTANGEEPNHPANETATSGNPQFTANRFHHGQSSGGKSGSGCNFTSNFACAGTAKIAIASTTENER